MIWRSVPSCVRPANAGTNSRHGITVAVGGLRWTGQNGRPTTPAAHVQTREHFGTEPKETDSSKNVNKNTEGRLWGLKNTDRGNKQLQLELGEIEASGLKQRPRTFQRMFVAFDLQPVTNQRLRSAPCFSLNGVKTLKLSKFEFYFLLVQFQNPIGIILDQKAVIRSSFSNLEELVEHEGFRQFYFKGRTEPNPQDEAGPGW